MNFVGRVFTAHVLFNFIHFRLTPVVPLPSIEIEGKTNADEMVWCISRFLFKIPPHLGSGSNEKTSRVELFRRYVFIITLFAKLTASRKVGVSWLEQAFFFSWS